MLGKIVVTMRRRRQLNSRFLSAIPGIVQVIPGFVLASVTFPTVPRHESAILDASPLPNRRPPVALKHRDPFRRDENQ
jgi:hypothetical protein